MNKVDNIKKMLMKVITENNIPFRVIANNYLLVNNKVMFSGLGQTKILIESESLNLIINAQDVDYIETDVDTFLIIETLHSTIEIPYN